MTRDPVDRTQLDDYDAANTAQEIERQGSTNQNRSYPAAVVYTMLSRGLRDPRAYADVVRKFPYASREIFLLLNNAFGMAFAQSIMKRAEDPPPATATSQASGPADNPAPDGSNRVSFSAPAADLSIDDAGSTCDLPEGTGVVASSTPAVVQDPAVNTKVQSAAANTSVAGSTTTTSPAQSGHPATASGLLPTRSPVDHTPNPGGGPHVTAPKSGINRAGFIDNSDGANLRTGPAELGGQKIRDLPLPPGSRVFVSGTHPDASHWWYVTAYLDDTMVRGYVQDFRVTTELPEPTAKLHQVISGDTAEKLAAKEYGSSVRDGHDLRYYENVLLYVNHQQHRAGITGVYQDPGVLGGGSNNVQLVAGHRIWLVSPAYAKALETVVPSGSLTGGAVAKVKRFIGHLEDILHSVTRCPHYFDEVAGEYAQAIRDHEAEIIGITAGFIMAEATSLFLAATPTGVGQIASVVIQLALSAFGAAGAVMATAEATKHATEWLTIAWTAQGKDDVIALASREFLKMLVGIAMAALSVRGAKTNYRSALKIANSMPTGGLPALAFAHSGQSGRSAADASGTGVSIGSGTGALGAAGNAMQRVGDDEPIDVVDYMDANASRRPPFDGDEHLGHDHRDEVCYPEGYSDLTEQDGYQVTKGRDPDRPTWQESEQHVSDDLDSAGFSSQRSFIGGKDVPLGTPGSTRPDNYSEPLRLSVDVKNYGIETIKGQTRLVKNVVRQITRRGAHLPKGSRQAVVIDARGQTVTLNQIAALRARIVCASDGLIAPDDIVFLTE